MSEYSATTSLARQYGGRPSVGQRIGSGAVAQVTHPMYEEYTRHVSEVFRRNITKATEQRTRAQQAIVTPALPSAVQHEVGLSYPEFRVVWAKMGAPVHSHWVARRELTNQLMTHYSKTYAQSWLHYGGSALAYVTASIEQVHLEVDVNNTVAMHDNATDETNMAALMANVNRAATEAEWYLPMWAKDKYVEGSWRKCSHAVSCVHEADALIVDGSVYPMNPGQFMHAMNQHKSVVGYMSIPYDSAMLVKTSGELGDTGVHFEMLGSGIRILYPEGTVGNTYYPAVAWNQWLLNIERSHESLDHNYMFEIINERTPFMIIRVVRIDKRVVPHRTIKHSLKLVGMEDMILVKTWRLKSLVSAPGHKDSWQPVVEMVPKRSVEKVYEFAMALSPDEFSRTNIRKRIENVNTRVVVNGTTVTVRPMMTAKQVDAVESAIFLRAFIDRYAANQLSQHVMQALREYASFGEMGFFERVAILIRTMLSNWYDFTLGHIDNVMRDAFDSARTWLRTKRVPFETSFDLAPQFVTFETVMGGPASGYLAVMDALSDISLSAMDLVTGVSGYVQTTMFGTSSHIQDVPVVDVADVQFEQRVGEIYSDVVTTSLEAPVSESGRKLLQAQQRLNFMDQANGTRHVHAKFSYKSNVSADIDRDDYSLDPGFINTLNEAHAAAFPGMEQVDYTMDFASMALDDQHRNLAADRLQLPVEPGVMPSTSEVYMSKITAYRTLKRRNTMHETVSALQARNLAAPVVAIPQNDDLLIHDVWNNFLDTMCVPDARAILAGYAADPVAMEKQAFEDWTKKADPTTIAKVFKYLVDNPTSWEEMDTAEYDVMVKADVKPPLSDKPVHTYMPPQVIVYHKPYINAVYSSIFRVLVPRFEALLLPHVFVNWLKDTAHIVDVMQNNHPWGHDDLHYLENDFSKYDKSQGEFVHKLESFVFEQLGMNEDMLRKWQLGHVDCRLRSVTTSVSLWVKYQRKSGDATTSFGNGLINLLSVSYVYRGTDIAWAVFIGDDSLVCARRVCGSDTAVQALEEQFNLLAKYYITTSPYFASCFYVIDDRQRRIVAVPDPFKRIEKWSVARYAQDPKWSELYRSTVDSCKVYRRRGNLVGLDKMLAERYALRSFSIGAIGDAIASAIRSERDFRTMWETEPVKLIV